MIELFNKILKRHDVTKKSFAERIGIGYGTVRNGTGRSNKSIPNWVKSFLFGYNLGKKPKE